MHRPEHDIRCLSPSFYILRQGYSWNHKLTVFGRLASQCAFEICLSLLPATGVIGVCGHAHLFIWVLSI